MKTFKTPKGTELPILDMRGKPYLQVAHRLVWMREEHPDWGITTEIVHHDEKRSVMRARILDGSGRVLAEATKQESAAGFQDHIEKAETGSIGRALAMCGYGTQFCSDDFDEGQRLADAPIPFSKPTPAKWNNLLGKIEEIDNARKIGNSEDFMDPPSFNSVVPPSSNPGAYTMTFGKFRGKTLEQIGAHDIENYASWMKSEAKKKNEPPNAIAQEALDAIEAFVKTRERKLGSQRDIFE